MRPIFGPAPTRRPTSTPPRRGVAERLVDYRLIDIGPRRIALGRPGMGVTLNSIGQGFVADRIADMLGEQGFTHVYADLGEIRLIGDHPDGRPWRIGLRDPKDQANFGRMLDLEDIGLAVSGGYGTPFEETGRYQSYFRSAHRAVGRQDDRHSRHRSECDDRQRAGDLDLCRRTRTCGKNSRPRIPAPRLSSPQPTVNGWVHKPMVDLPRYERAAEHRVRVS